MLELQNVSLTIQAKKILQNISISFSEGNIYGVLGPNGSGKTSLLKILCGLIPTSQGNVLLQKQNLTTQCRQKISEHIAYVPQNPLCLFDFTVEELVAMGGYSNSSYRKASTQLKKSKITEALQFVNALHLRKNLLHTLSGGERQRVYIARALMSNSPILLLDEPTASLDIGQQLHVWQLLTQLKNFGKLVIMSVHDLNSAEEYCDELILLNEGCCIAQGAIIDLPLQKFIQSAYGVIENPLQSSRSYQLNS